MLKVDHVLIAWKGIYRGNFVLGGVNVTNLLSRHCCGMHFIIIIIFIDVGTISSIQ